MIGHNPVKDLKPDADGYYHVTLAIPSKVAPSGRKYDPKQVGYKFEEMLTRAPIYVEFGTPTVDHLTCGEVVHRAAQVHLERVCGVIASGSVEDDRLVGRFKPTGPMGDRVHRLLAEPENDLCFGIRSVGFNGCREAPEFTIQTLVTFDVVSEPYKVISIDHQHHALDLTLRGGYTLKLLEGDLDRTRVNSVLLRVYEDAFKLEWFEGIQWKTGHVPTLLLDHMMLILLQFYNGQWHGELKVSTPQ
jgi:hypothetical protein